MAGGGHIIIRSRIASIADSPSIKERLTPGRRARHEQILSKSPADWSEDDAHFVLRNIGQAHDSFTD
jgi:hypothetical protein